MRHRHHGCGPRDRFEFTIPEGLFAMRGGHGRGRHGWRGGWNFGFDDEEDGSRRGGRRRMFEGGQLRLVLLKLVAEEPRHGYDLIRAIEELTGGRYAPSPGVVYPTLTLLDEMGLIEQAPGEGARKPFQITEPGRAHLEKNGEEADELINRLKALSPSHYPEGGSPIWRAMRNLGVAIRNRVAEGEITDETKFELAALIDELAQKIERLK